MDSAFEVHHCQKQQLSRLAQLRLVIASRGTQGAVKAAADGFSGRGGITGSNSHGFSIWPSGAGAWIQPLGQQLMESAADVDKLGCWRSSISARSSSCAVRTSCVHARLPLILGVYGKLVLSLGQLMMP
jgi:hypothetical protein